MSPSSKVGQAVAGGGGGALLGIIISFLVNEALYEISVNAFFAILFGSSLLFMGSLILYRVNALSWNSSLETPKKSMSTYFVMLFAVLVILAGLFCFFLEKNWFQFISPMVKIPMYVLLGIALWFALTFSIMDLLNFIGQYLVMKMTKGRKLWNPIVSTPSQIAVVLSASVFLGIFFGIVFGSLDVEDAASEGLQRDLHFTIPVGAIVCCLVGIVNQMYLRPNMYASPNGMDETYTPRAKAAYDDGI